jgi:hypothetical protein
MKNNVLKKALIVVTACWCSGPLPVRAIVLAPLPRPIVSTAYSFNRKIFFVGTEKTAASQNWSLAAAGSANTEFYPIAPEKATINGIADQPNPLYDQTIPYIAVMGGAPLVAPAGDTAVVYQVVDFAKPEAVKMLATAPLPDSTGAPAKGVFGLGAFTKVDRSQFAVAVKPASGNPFGTAGSAVVFGILTKIKEKAPSDEDPNAGKEREVLLPLSAITVVPDSAVFKIGGDLASIDNAALSLPVALYGSETFRQFYTGICATAGANPGDGVRGVVMGLGAPLAPDAAMGTNSIIGSSDADAQVVIRKLTIIETSTRPFYLIVWGGVGTPTATQNMVFALPLVSVVTPATQQTYGALAKKTSPLVDVWGEPPLRAFMGRGFSQAATVAGDLFGPTDYQVQVGGGADLPGSITDVWADKDAVFVSVEEVPGNDQHGGVFYSQAIFAADGRINGWTAWQRAGGFIGSVYQLTLDPTYSHIWNVIADANSIENTVLRTEWTPDSGFAKSVSNLLGMHAGVQNILDIPFSSPACTTVVDQRISPQCCTGYQTVLLAQSGADQGTMFTPAGTLSSVQMATDGAVGTLPTGCEGILFTGGALNSLGAIVTATLASDANYNWLIVGGNYGVAVLSKANGQGWAVGGLSKNFGGLDADLRWSLLAFPMPSPQVRRVWVDGVYLYVLTTEVLIRYPVAPATFAGGSTVTGTVIARVENLNPPATSFADVAVSGPVALLATSTGLFQLAPGLSARTVADDAAANWQRISLAESAGPVTALYPISSTNTLSEFATAQTGGTVYVLCAYTGYHQAQEYRVAVQETDADGVVTAATVQVIPDQFAQDTLSYLFSRANYRNCFAYNGAVMLMSSCRYFPDAKAPFLEVLNPAVRTGIRFSTANSITVVQNVSGSKMGPIVTRSATGGWFVGGDMVFVNE